MPALPALPAVLAAPIRSVVPAVPARLLCPPGMLCPPGPGSVRICYYLLRDLLLEGHGNGIRRIYACIVD
ncbi:hypothetical protein CALCODRAFT_495693 [Calocera cornea HHB12733]|uniref:Uncharacterized protein n=1 Tax=Calocera cornea HHB12733 TaxID=1353952 RepID=A0A165GBH7_9BASI|nr:hypothetical protein CALCODRAFT_495693 [Calocera cornea HHB12733]